ncbi:MerR family transcriptional regulator [Pelotomaculum propionicicum]|uniref:Mercuric resistance operon regulatory protein n=1 Tax=Pelotomaculum propionicicum TaxID=258475 RepID=A0A4Y7RK72_9FIRM|nr:MerR family transcriptional regulator [Pelotomaculum propionicicum]TEB09243.1 Mercuric resistance operon regulatory protein [Pelotomaculum propionicicum]
MDGHLRMKEIVERTGENKSTILHYIHLGLLPEPLRTSKNMAYYPGSYVKLLNIIRTLQSKYFLPLHAIKRILDLVGPNPSIDRAVQIYDFFYKKEYAASEDADCIYNRKGFLREVGLTERELAQLEKLQLLIPFEKDVYNADDLAVARSLMAIKQLKISLRDIEFLPELVVQLAQKSIDFRDRTVKGMSEEEEWEVTRFLSSNLLWFLSYLTRRFINRELKENSWGGI